MAGKQRFNGTSGNDTIAGSALADILAGRGGDDIYIVNHAGDEVVESSNQGNDTILSWVSYALSANVENLTLAGAGALNATGNSQNNVMTGNNSANVLDGGAGADTMVGLGGNDTYHVENAGDVVVEEANAGTDTVLSSVTYALANHVENLTLTGNSAINATGNSLANALVGNGAANTVDGGAGADSMAGGGGNDTYIVDDLGDVVTEHANQGTDTVRSSVRHTLGANVENLVLVGAAAIDATGNSHNNALTGNSAANILDGGSGEDAMAGGAGNDVYVVDNPDDSITEGLNAGIDTVQSSVSRALDSNVENLTLTGTQLLTVGVGNGLDNVIIGTNGIDILAGRAGNDTITGAGGLDYIDGGSGVLDTAVYSGALSHYQITPLQAVFPFLESGWNLESGSPGNPHTGPYRFGAFVSDQRAGAPDGTDVVRNVEVLQFADRSVFIDGRNNAPVAVGETDSGTEDTELVMAVSTLLANDSDFDGNTLTIASVGNAVNGSVILDGADVRFTPAADFFGSASFTYLVSDGAGGFAEAHVDIDVAPVNDAAILSADVRDLTETNSAADISSSGMLTIDDVDSLEEFQPTTTTGAYGTFDIDQTGLWTYAADSAHDEFVAGQLYTDAFTVASADGTLTSVTINILGTADVPVAADDTASGDEDTIITGSVLDNDTPGGSPPLTAALLVGTANGQLVLDANGTFSYMPGANFYGADSFTYIASDDSGDSNVATVTIAVNPVNDAPVTVDSLIATNVDRLVPGRLGATDVEGGSLTFSVVQGPTHGTLELETTGHYVYTPEAGYTGGDSFDYTVMDDDGAFASGTASITVATGDAPKNLPGGAGNDSFIGGDLDDQLSGASGDDRLQGLTGDDTLIGGEGDDTLIGDGGADNLSDTEGGQDDLTGGDGNDFLFSSDFFVTEGGADTLDGGIGNDTLIREGAGANTFASTLLGGEGNDSLSIHLFGSGAAETALLDGGDGDDSFYASVILAGASELLQIEGGDGNDTIDVSDAQVQTAVTGGAGNDTIHGLGSGEGHSAEAGSDADTVHLTLNAAVSVTLGTGADRLVVDSWNGASAVTVADFTVGEDKLDFTGLLGALQGWDGILNPFGAGYLRFAQDGPDALFQVDSDGEGDGYVTLARLQNLVLTATPITSAELIPAIAPDDTPPAGQTIEGDGADNVLIGTPGADTLRGFGGNDQLFGAQGADVLEGGDDHDVLHGEAGSDVLDGGAGDDQLFGASGNDVLYGREGNDSLTGGAGDDELDGGTQDDNLSDSEGGQDDLTGGDGNDFLFSSDFFVAEGGADTLDGGIGNDTLIREAGGANTFASTLLGGEGNDSLSAQLFGSGDAATALLDGGTGNDTFLVSVFAGGNELVQIEGGDGDDTIDVSDAQVQTAVTGGAGNDTIHGLGSADGHSADAGSDADTIHLTLNAAVNVTLGTGADRLVVDSWNGASAVTVADFTVGEDKLDITALLPALQGWDGNNLFGGGYLRFMQDGPDVLFQVDSNGGGDGYVTLARLQNLDLTATPITAAELIPAIAPGDPPPVGQTIEGDGADNVLIGTLGADTLRGFGGNDQLFGSFGADVLEGGDDHDELYGEVGDDVLDGGSGEDQLFGEGGNDALYGREGNDALTGGTGDDDLDGGTQDDSLSDTEGGQDDLIGGEGNDTLFSSDFFVADGGADTLDGGIGNDTLIREAGGANTFGSTLTGGEGHDSLSVQLLGSGAAEIALLDGGAGNDSFYASVFLAGPSELLQIEGGDGDDTVDLGDAHVQTIVAGGSGNDTIHGLGSGEGHSADAGSDADTIHLTLNAAVNVTLGTGADRLEVDSWSGASAVTVTDFAVTEDTLDLRDVLFDYDGNLAGFVQLSPSAGDTLLSVDQDGGGDNFVLLATLQNVTHTGTLLNDLVASGNLVVA